MSDLQIKVLAIVGVLFVLLFIIGHYVDRRRFIRTNLAGVQEYKSYFNKMLSDAWEACLGCIFIPLSFIFVACLFWLVFLFFRG